ncbi:MAG: restriction endonuclease, partial [Luteimonas sp.]
MIAALLAVGACLAAGLSATWFLYSKRLPRERRVAGRALLAAMDHADFMQLVLAVLNGRGYERTFGGGGTEGEYLVERHGRGWLLSSKYSHAYTPDSSAIAEFANYLRHRAVPGGVLAITGRFPRAAFGVARAHRVELLDSDNMWDELQPLLDEKQLAAIDRPARARLKWQFALAWLAAVAIGAAVYLGEREVEGDAPAQRPAAVMPAARLPATGVPASAPGPGTA